MAQKNEPFTLENVIARTERAARLSQRKRRVQIISLGLETPICMSIIAVVMFGGLTKATIAALVVVMLARFSLAFWEMRLQGQIDALLRNSN